MQDLRLVGVHDDGGHLLLSGPGGAMFQLPIDEALRAAASRTPAQVAARASITPVAMSPRDIQARIRSGATAAEVAELSGLPLANVQRYEGPVLAERDYVAQQARKVEVASPVPGHDAYRTAFGDNPATLEEMVGHRLSAHGIDPSTVEWDSWRRADGSWTVVARFEAVPAAAGSIGEEPPAMWTFSPQRKALQNANRWAQQLSELEPLDGPVPARRLTAVSDRPFDFEADAHAASRAAAKDSDNLLEMLRSRRGQRLGVDEDADDALAALLSNVPAAHPRPEADGSAQDTGQDPAVEIPADAPAANKDNRQSMLSRLSLAPRHSDSDDAEDSLRLHDGVSTETREITVVAGPLRPVAPLEGRKTPSEPHPEEEAKDSGKPAAPVKRPGLDELLGGSASAESRTSRVQTATEHQDTEAKERPGAKGDEAPVERQPSRPKRSSIPSWDEIVFGARGD
ncbi:septation protein SepH [Paenarthrobacter ureafaciens]|uniref:septation protein SepH n=1 Tax=Paenarthrobacter TaxID=1742992 RepID=UPI002231FD89|nr:septation protein SepH [Paenarthrobacter sp. PAE-2]MCW3765426.1 septation protein SepH [Paenarthrobacter sp. PAE-2]